MHCPPFGIRLLAETSDLFQWRSDAVRGRGSAVRSEPKAHCSGIAQKAYGFQTLA